MIFHRKVRELYPSGTLQGWRNRIKLSARRLFNYSRTAAWWAFLDQPAMRPIAKQHFTLFEVIHRPYLHRGWSGAQRYVAVLGHYRLVESLRDFSFYDAHLRPVSLWTDEIEGRRVELALHKDRRFCREGELALSLFVDGQRQLSLAFLLAELESRRVIYVGCLQGTSAPDCKETLAACTRAMHGLRPRDLLLWALRQIGQEIDARDIYAISHRFQQYASWHYTFGGGKTIQANYDDAWTEAGGVALSNGFFHLPVQVEERPLSEVKSSKRAMYRRRYEMLAAMRQEILVSLHRRLGPVAEGAPPAKQLQAPVPPRVFLSSC
ncbi:VirK/YbjX family protein [Oryzomicrobium sp.]|uniref:VirK/YbjX family protein n=1 Tax=Oryzomicrobium sp. TaxID=1911578 RepID=UPI002FE3C393